MARAGFAVTTQQRLGIAVAAVLLVGWILYLIANSRRPEEPPGSEIELAPNRRPYLDDEAMEGRRLERALGWSLILLAVVAIGLPLYWLDEPSRQAGAIRGFDRRAVNRGHSLFLPSNSPEHGAHFGCETCHGPEGSGGATLFTTTDVLGAQRQVRWQVPSLNDVLLRFSPEEVRSIIVFGRANTPMPAWGIEGGGPMNAQQVDDLVAYIGSIQISPEEAREKAAALGTDGEALFNANCARCHTKGFSFGEPEVPAAGAFGPNLTNGVTLRQFPNRQLHIDFITAGSEANKAYGVRGVGSGRMPGFGSVLTAEQIEAIVDYERSR